jgi:sporulation protein YlmC with PRC-barrel domain
MTMNKLSKFAICAVVLPAGSLAAGVAYADPYADADANEQTDQIEQQSQTDATDRDPMDNSTTEHGTSDYDSEDPATADYGTQDHDSVDQGTMATDQDSMDVENGDAAETAQNASDSMKDATYISSAPAYSINSGKIVGSQLQMNSTGEEVGEIDDLVINESGRIVAAVVNIGGVLGMGEHSVAVSWSSIERRMNEDQDGYSFRVNATLDQLEEAPEYSQENTDLRVSSTATE